MLKTIYKSVGMKTILKLLLLTIHLIVITVMKRVDLEIYLTQQKLL